MNFFTNIHETQISRNYPQPTLTQRAPLRLRLFPTAKSAGEVARAAVREVLG